MSHLEFANYLLEKEKISESELNQIERLLSETEDSFVQLVLKLGIISERDLATNIANYYDLPLVQEGKFPLDKVLDEDISKDFFNHFGAAPISVDEQTITLAVSDPTDQYVVKAIALALDKEVLIEVGSSGDISKSIEQQYGSSTEAEDISTINTMDDIDDIERLKDLASEAPIIRLVNSVIRRALDARASDIHVEPFPGRLLIRYRVDGVLKEIESVPTSSTSAVISRIKVLSNLNIAERRLPQDGRIKIRIEGREIDMRISTIPTIYGESVVMRILDKKSVELDLKKLGFAGATLDAFEQMIKVPHGIILVTGPTGSGKTTTLYAALSKINTPDKKILTVEDPVEYELDGINQIHVKPKIGLSFASALRSILRQDPDVIMIGEMRDLETAKIAVQSALTGHKVFSTLHTNDAASSITRLLDMGVEDYLVTSTVNGVIAQRLIRCLCDQCKIPHPNSSALITELELEKLAAGEEITLYDAVGCEKCEQTGFLNRSCILEVMLMSESLRKATLQQGDADSIRKVAREEGTLSMRDDGLLKAIQGITTVEEVERVIQDA